MKYFFISDVHGCYFNMIKALYEAGFDKEKDTLVSLGDPFDRGSQSKKILEYFMSCPNAIFIWGNHDKRLKELMFGARSDRYDKMNGVPQTLQSFCEMEKEPSIYWGIEVFKSDSRYKDTKNALYDYFDKCVWAIEFKDLIGTHAWLPDGDWRAAKVYEWEEAIWSNTEKAIKENKFPDKKLIVGHWHTWRLAAKFGSDPVEISESYRGEIDCRTFYYEDKLIAIDGCVNWPYGGRVNVYVYESEEQPKLW